jgi:hypothetical protein
MGLSTGVLSFSKGCVPQNTSWSSGDFQYEANKVTELPGNRPCDENDTIRCV